MVMKVNGCIGVLPIECVNPRKNKWKVRWNITEKEDGSSDWYEQDYDQKPTLEEIRDTIVKFHNGQVDAKILSGFSWKDMPVWLSSENQFNYKASFDLAVQTNGQNLPVRFKFGTDKDPKYYDFKTVDELSDFYTSAIKFINDTLQEGWAEKDSVDFSVYSI